MARKAGQGKEEEESRARQQEEKTPVRDEEEKKPACHGGGHDVVEQGLPRSHDLLHAQVFGVWRQLERVVLSSQRTSLTSFTV
ncbi:hypothetical protein STEG23_011534 [Scotinomys teguina]